MNFAEPLELHDYRFLGDGFRQRECIRRQQARWVRRLARMDRLQRQALLAAIRETGGSEHQAASAEHVGNGEGRSRRRPGRSR
jgi:hypothetical protein